MAQSNTFSVEGNIFDAKNARFVQGEVHVENGIIKGIEERASKNNSFFLPGLVDSHIHVESSLLVPTEFARLAVRHGTVATVSDPHEIGNVLGVDGVYYMLNNAEQTPLKILFGAPSCVPATSSALETSGKEITAEQVAELLRRPDIGYEAEMMNFPGVLNADDVVTAKIEAARRIGKPIDGHFPGGRGEEARRYAEAGYPGEVTISTDHECFTLEEAMDKLKYGMKISIREGSAAQNLEALHELFSTVPPDQIMLCSDDRHPDTLIEGHINELMRRLVGHGHDPIPVILSATKTPIDHYNMNVGLLQPGDPADFIRVDDLKDFKVRETYIDGELVSQDGECLLPSVPVEVINNFNRSPVTTDQLIMRGETSRVRVIDVIDGELITKEGSAEAPLRNGEYQTDLDQDLLKIAVINRYGDTPPALAYVRGFKLKYGALASSVGHDCHNIVAVGTNDADLAQAINMVIEKKGGLSLASGSHQEMVPLPVAGIMSDQPGEKVAAEYATLDQQARDLGSSLRSPFMSLSFLALLVIPKLKLSDKGLFDGESFSFVSLEQE